MFTLDRVVPWGRSFDEYRRMFELGESDLAGKILGCADGPASFNAEATRRGVRAASCDPLYRHGAAEIRSRIAATFLAVLDQTRQNAHEFVWDEIPSIERLAEVRSQAMETFLADYDAGRTQGRYIDAELPTLPFADAAFDLAVCSHFLFLYSDQLSESFHVESVRELCRVAREVRVFPLLALGSRPSPHVEPVVEALQRQGLAVSLEQVPYEFQRGGNRMLRIRTV